MQQHLQCKRSQINLCKRFQIISCRLVKRIEFGKKALDEVLLQIDVAILTQKQRSFKLFSPQLKRRSRKIRKVLKDLVLKFLCFYYDYYSKDIIALKRAVTCLQSTHLDNWNSILDGLTGVYLSTSMQLIFGEANSEMYRIMTLPTFVNIHILFQHVITTWQIIERCLDLSKCHDCAAT